MARQYPLANKTFTVYRRNQTTTVGNNIVPIAAGSTTPISTGESVLLKNQSGDIVNDKGATVFVSAFLGTTFANTPIVIGDILADETENKLDGTPVRYEVMDRFIYPWYCKLALKRFDVGA